MNLEREKFSGQVLLVQQLEEQIRLQNEKVQLLERKLSEEQQLNQQQDAMSSELEKLKKESQESEQKYLVHFFFTSFDVFSLRFLTFKQQIDGQAKELSKQEELFSQKYSKLGTTSAQFDFNYAVYCHLFFYS